MHAHAADRVDSKSRRVIRHPGGGEVVGVPAAPHPHVGRSLWLPRPVSTRIEWHSPVSGWSGPRSKGIEAPEDDPLVAEAGPGVRRWMLFQLMCTGLEARRLVSLAIAATTDIPHDLPAPSGPVRGLGPLG